MKKIINLIISILINSISYSQYSISTFIGKVPTLEGVNAKNLQLSPGGIFYGGDNKLYFYDTEYDVIRSLDQNSRLSIVAGNGTIGNLDNGSRSNQLTIGQKSNYLIGSNHISIDSKKNIYIIQNSRQIRKIDTAGNITTVAGTGNYGYSGDGGSALFADFMDPICLTHDKYDNLYVSDISAHVVRKINPQGVISTFAGNGFYIFDRDGIPATSVSITSPHGIVFDREDNLYIADNFNQRIFKVNKSGILTTFAGTGFSGNGKDGGPAISTPIYSPGLLSIDFNNNLYFSSSGNSQTPWRIRKINSSGIISTIAGGIVNEFMGDGGAATKAGFVEIRGMAVDSFGNVYLSDIGRLRKIDQFGIINTIAGTGEIGFNGDGIIVSNAQLGTPSYLEYDKNGILYIADHSNNRIRKVDKSGLITTIAGNGKPGYPINGDKAINSKIYVGYISADDFGKVYFNGGTITNGEIINNNIIYRIEENESINTYAGNGQNNFNGDGKNALSTSFSDIRGSVFNMKGDFLIVDAGNYRIRSINKDGIVSTIAGDGTYGVYANYGDGGKAISARFKNPVKVRKDKNGNIFIVDSEGHCIRKIDTSGVISTVAGSGKKGYDGDGGNAKLANLNWPQDVCIDKFGNLYIADALNYRIRKVDTSGLITTIAGTGIFGFNGDKSDALLANLTYVSSIVIDTLGNVFFTDVNSHLVRKLVFSPIVPTVTTQSATNITSSTAILNGTVNPRGSSTSSISIRYSTVKADVDGGSGTLATVSPTSVSGSTVTNITANVTGLTPSTTYYFRASATNAGGTGSGTTLSFTTSAPSPVSPLVTTQAATNITTNAATLNGTVNAQGNATTSITIRYSIIKADVDGGSGTLATVSPTSVSGSTAMNITANLTGLTTSTTYYFRASATNAGGTANGATLSFTTSAPSPVAPLVTTQAATNIMTNTATLNGTVNAQGSATNSITIRYSAVKADVDGGSGTLATVSPASVSGSTATNISANVTGLTPSTTYYFRASAANAGGTVNGATLSFTTSAPSPVAPSVTTQAATNITTNAATLNGTVNAQGSVTTSITIRYSTVKADVDGGSGTLATVSPTSVSGSTATNITANITGLTPSTTYYFRASATNAGGSANGVTLSFTTSAPSPVAPLVTTQVATNITTNAATLNGTVNAQGSPTTSITIRYSTVKADVDGGTGILATVSPTIVSGSTSSNITANVTGLTPSTTYYFRASATNAGGIANGSTLSFTTRGISDTAVVFTDSALNITTTSATLKGIANARGLSVTSVFIHYSSDRALLEAGSGINATVTPNTINGNSSFSFSANISGLTPNTTYYYRATATNLWSTVRGTTRSFTTSTPIQAPVVLTLPTTDIGLNTAVLYGSVNPNGSQTSSITLKYSTIKADVDAGNGLSPIVNPTSITGFIPTLITANLTGLQPNTTYFYRASATTPGGVRNGATLSFTTISSADILVPSAFSPNGDGQNDLLVPIAVGIRSLSYFKIMNRWGQLVFETKELGKGWDGNFKGVPQPRDTYSWVIEALDVTGKTVRKSGGCLLVR